MIKFSMFAASSIGPKYSSRGWDCQDSSRTISFGNVQAIAVADGHGGSDYFRSAIGSKLAIDVLCSQLKDFCHDLNETERLSDTGIKNFKYDFVKKWRQAVKKDWDDRLSNGAPLGEGEIRYKSVSEKYRARYTSKNPSVVENYLYVAYGTTLICAVSTGTQILFLQIGDGTCVLLQRNGEFRVPIPSDEENYLNVTASLCDKEAELKIRHAVLDCDVNSPSSPVAIFLSTDGLDDCFPYYQNEEYLYQLYADVVLDDMIKTFGVKTNKEIEEKLLPELTRKSSQDDISLAYLVIRDPMTLKKAFNQIDARYKSAPTPPKISQPQPVKTPTPEKVPAPAQEKVVKTFAPPKVSSTLTQKPTPTPAPMPKVDKPDIKTPPFMKKVSSTPTPTPKVDEPEIKIPPFMNSQPPQPSTQTQSVFKARHVSLGAPVPVGGSQQTLEGGITR